jgi:hypothetical protein
VKTLVYPPPSGVGHTAYVGVIAHLMTDQDADAIVGQLEEQGIPVAISHGPGCWVNLRPTEPVTTLQEVRAIRIVEDVTDAPVRWAGTVS